MAWLLRQSCEAGKEWHPVTGLVITGPQIQIVEPPAFYEAGGFLLRRHQPFLMNPASAVDRNLMDEHKIMNAEEIRRALARVAHEILERNKGTQDLVMVGIFTRGVPLAHRLARLLLEFEGNEVPVAALDVRPYRDDLSNGASPRGKTDGIVMPVQDRRVVLVDDVLYTGRTVRAAMDALNDFGRPKQVQLAILLDRGHRELPIRADYVGRNVPTSRKERVHVRLREIDEKEEVVVSAAGAGLDVENTRRRAPEAGG